MRSFGKMELSIQVNGKEECKMEKDKFFILMEVIEKAGSKTISF